MNAAVIGNRFSVDPNTGLVLINRPLHEDFAALSNGGGGTGGSASPVIGAKEVEFPLRIRACDRGQPQLCSSPVAEYRALLVASSAAATDVASDDAALRVPSQRDRGRGRVNGQAGRSGFSSELAIICLVMTFLLLTAACAAVVCLVLARRRSLGRHSASASAATTMPAATGATSSPVAAGDGDMEDAVAAMAAAEAAELGMLDGEVGFKDTGFALLFLISCFLVPIFELMIFELLNFDWSITVD